MQLIRSLRLKNFSNCFLFCRPKAGSTSIWVQYRMIYYRSVRNNHVASVGKYAS